MSNNNEAGLTGNQLRNRIGGRVHRRAAATSGSDLPRSAPRPPVEGSACAHRSEFSQFGLAVPKNSQLGQDAAEWQDTRGVGGFPRTAERSPLAVLLAPQRAGVTIATVLILRERMKMRTPNAVPASVDISGVGAPALMRAPTLLRGGGAAR